MWFAASATLQIGLFGYAGLQSLFFTDTIFGELFTRLCQCFNVGDVLLEPCPSMSHFPPLIEHFYPGIPLVLSRSPLCHWYAFQWGWAWGAGDFWAVCAVFAWHSFPILHQYPKCHWFSQSCLFADWERALRRCTASEISSKYCTGYWVFIIHCILDLLGENLYRGVEAE